MKTVKNVTLNGYSRVDGRDVLTMSATISQENTGTSYSHFVNDIATYDANLEKCRGDVTKFLEKVWAVEDEMVLLRAGGSEEIPEAPIEG